MKTEEVLLTESYYEHLFTDWMNLVHMGLVQKDSVGMFARFGQLYSTYIVKYATCTNLDQVYPDQSDILNWISYITTLGEEG